MNSDRVTITNFRRVHDWLYRGGQPSARQYRELKDLGIRTVITMRWSSEILRTERKAVQDLNLNYVPIPLSYWTMPTRKDIERFFSVIADESLHPIFLHCKHGCDRTGMFIAMYRMTKEGWTFEEAYKEMCACGFHKIRMHQYKWILYAYWRRLQREKRRQAAK